MRKCVYRQMLDLETLVCTRGPNFPLGRLEGRLMCPACGNRRVTVVFEPPSNAAQMGEWVRGATFNLVSLRIADFGHRHSLQEWHR